MKTSTKKMIITALCIALCVVLPWAFHAIPNAGSVLCPMHIPVLLCGLVCGWQYGLACGVLGPFLSSILTQMPPMGYLPPMLVELAVYGFASGFGFYPCRVKKYMPYVYLRLLCAMLLGRVAAGAAKAWVFMPGTFTAQMWVMSYFVTAWPGIVLQLILIPVILVALRKAKVL